MFAGLLALAGCQAALDGAIKTASYYAAAGVAAERELSRVCLEAVDQHVDDGAGPADVESRVRAVLAQCDHAWALHDVYAAELDVLIALLEAGKASDAPDLAAIATAGERVERALRAFKAAAAVVTG